MVSLETRGPCSFQVAVAVSTAGVPALGVWSRRTASEEAKLPGGGGRWPWASLRPSSSQRGGERAGRRGGPEAGLTGAREVEQTVAQGPARRLPKVGDLHLQGHHQP